MADISILNRMVNGLPRNVDISSNTLVMSSLKLGTSELTKAQLDLLILTTDSPSAVDASAQHHHDGRYYTETELDGGQLDNRYFTESELGSTADGSSGASLIGVDQTPAFTNISGANIQAIIESIDSALGTAGGNEFDDANFRIFDGDGDSLGADFDVSAVTTADKTITMPDADVDLGDIALNNAHRAGDGSDHQDVADLATLSGVAANSTDLGTFTGDTIPDAQTIKQALQALETKAENNTSLINGLEWQDSALDYIVDNTAAPPTEVSGDRYILSHDGGAPNAAWDGASAGDIVEFNGSTWDATSPTTGMFISADDEDTLLYYWGGAAWIAKSFEATTASTGLTKTGFDIQLADAAANSGIVVSSGAISVSLATDPGLEFNANQLRVLVDPAGALERVAAGLDVADLGIDTARLAATSVTAAKLGSDVAGDGLKGGNGSAIDIEPADFAGSGLEDDGSDDLRIAAAAYDQDTITGGAGSAAAVQKAPLNEESMVAGESYAANTSFLVRMALDGETAGRVYKADKAAGSAGSETNTIYCFGLAQNRTGSPISAGSNIPVVKLGSAVLQSSDAAFTASQDEGLPVYLGASGAFTLSVSGTSDDAIVKVGNVRNVGGSSAIEMHAPQIMGIVE